MVYGISPGTISKKLPVSEPTVRSWIRTFAASNSESMPYKGENKRHCGQGSASDSSMSLEEEVRLLREENRRLKQTAAIEKLRADLNDEIISVAEQKFGIQIRKKAGTKQ